MKKTLLTLLGMMAIVASYAQIKYTDLNPDSSYTITPSGVQGADSAIYLDLDADNTDDFYFKYEYSFNGVTVNWWLQIHCTDTGNQAYWKSTSVSSLGNHYIKALQKGDSITKNVLFGKDLDPLLGDDVDDNLVSAGSKYIGIRFVSGGKTYYGWMLVEMVMNTSSGTMTVKSFAYNTTAGEGINAGDTCLPTKSDTAIEACNSIVWNGTTYFTTGTYTYTTTNSVGCDSIATLRFTNNQTASTISATACDSFTLNNTVYYQSGQYKQVLSNANAKGCDSTINLNLTILTATDTTVSLISCDSLQVNGISYYTTGNYTQNFNNRAGCDSTVHLVLTINKSTTSTLTATACDTFTANGSTYTTSGTYTQKLINSAGCDSVITLVLTINTSSVNTITTSACDSFTLNNTVYTQTGSYTQQLTNSKGCDSTIILNVTINHPTTNTIIATACSSYTLNGSTYTASGTYKQTLTNSAGCDSILTLVLTIGSINTNVIQEKVTLKAIDTAHSYQWLNCDNNYSAINGETDYTFVAMANGNYAVEITDGSCKDTSNCYAVISVGMENSFPLPVNLYPNPTSGDFTLSFGETYTNVTITVSTILGEVVSEYHYTTAKEAKLTIGAAQGIYIVSLSTPQYNTRIRLIKQ